MKPDFFLESYKNITNDFLLENNIKVILSDLDGTLAAENEMGTEEFAKWCSEIKNRGVSLIVVSNNTQLRVDSFIKAYEIVGYGKCRKPLKNRIYKLTKVHIQNPKEVLFLGDQIFTDVLCGKGIGVKTAVVKPIPGKETWKTKVKRGPERWLFKIWKQVR